MTSGWENNHKLIFRWIHSFTKGKASLSCCFFSVSCFAKLPQLCIYSSCNSTLLGVSVFVCDLWERETDWKRERKTARVCLYVLITAISDQRHAYPVCHDLFTAALRPERTSVLLHFPHTFQDPDSRLKCVWASVCSGCKSLRCANRYWHILNYSLVMMNTDILKSHMESRCRCSISQWKSHDKDNCHSN